MNRQKTIGLMIVFINMTAAVANVSFESSKQLDTTELVLKNRGTATFFNIDLYDAALYLEPDRDPLQWHRETARQLEISYFKPVKAEHFAKATDKLIQRNLKKCEYRQMKSTIDRFLALYRDVKPGDRYSLTYVPGKGTALALNGQPLGIFEGNLLSRALFAIWLGDKPISDDLRDQLVYGFD